MRNIQKTKGSYLISIPVALVRGFGWKERQKVNVKKMGKKIVISDWKK